MKPVVIIAIAVACSVVAVFGVSFVWEELEYQMALAEWDKMQESIVNAYNLEMQRCRATFVNMAPAVQCVENADKNFEIYKLDAEYSTKLESGISQEARDEFKQTLERYYGNNSIVLKELNLNAQNLEGVQVSKPTAVETPELTLTEIENLYLECKEKTPYGNVCKDKLKDMMDKICRITTDSQSDYDVCFGYITKII